MGAFSLWWTKNQYSGILFIGLNPELLYKMQDPHLLRNTAQIYKDIERAIRSFGPWSSTWVSESGSAYNSGGREVSHGFINSFW